MSEIIKNLNFEDIRDENELKSLAEGASLDLNEIALSDEKLHKQVVTSLLNKIHTQISTPTASPKSKLFSLQFMREFARKHATAERKEEKHSKLFSILAAHELLHELRNIAERVDPFKQVHEKGKSLFPASSALGNDFVRLVLELLRYWATKFPTTSKKEPTSYRRNYDELVDQKVLFPQEFKFLTFANPNPAQSYRPPEDAPYETTRSKPSMGEPQPSNFVTPGGPAPPAATRAGVLSTSWGIQRGRSTTRTAG